MSALPAGATACNVGFVSRCSQGGRPDGVQVIVHEGHAYIGHMFSDGFSVVDVRDAKNLPTPAEEDFCNKGAKFGPHNLHENRPGSYVSEDLIFATYHNAGLRIFDLRNPFEPKQAGFFVPPPPERIVDQRPNPAKVIQSCDVFVATSGLMYMTDTNAGLYIIEYEGKL